MATSALLVANPLTSLKQTSPVPFSRRRSLLTKPLQFTTASFKTQHLSSSSSSSSSSSPKYDLKLKCSSEKNQFTSDHASHSEANPTRDPLETIANQIFSNVLKGLRSPAAENPNPLEAIFNETLSNALKVLKTPAMAAVLLSLLLTFHPNKSWAASGGCVGGSSFSSGSSSSSSYSSDDYFSSSSPSYSYTSYSYSRPSSPSSYTEAQAAEAMFYIFVLFILIIAVICILAAEPSAAATSNVVKLQVGLLGTARALQRDLDRIAETADTSNRKGLSYVLTEATVALLRHPDYWISTYSSVTPNHNMEDAEKYFNKISIEERAKFDEETLVNLNNKRRKSSTSKNHDGFRNQYIVVTLLVAIEGKHKMATINSSDDLKKALENLGSIPSKNIAAVQVLWTPQQKNDTLSEEELMEDYPLLKRF